jgi:TolB protein
MPLPTTVNSLAGEAWSPVGNEIAFVERVDPSHQALWISRPDGAGARKLVEFVGYTIAGVDWTPDGRELLYGAVSDGRMQIFAISRDGGTPRQLTHESANMLHPAVSPDGKLVAASRIPWRKELRRMKLP